MKEPRNPKKRPLRPQDIKPDPVLTKLQQDYLAAGVFKPHDTNEMLHLLRGAIEKLASRLAPVLGPESEFKPTPHPTRSALAERLAGLTAEVEALTARVDV